MAIDSKLIIVAIETFIIVPILSAIVLYGPTFLTDVLGASSAFAGLIPILAFAVTAIAYQLLSPEGVAMFKKFIGKE